jgi:hypothetical protein
MQRRSCGLFRGARRRLVQIKRLCLTGDVAIGRRADLQGAAQGTAGIGRGPGIRCTRYRLVSGRSTRREVRNAPLRRSPGEHSAVGERSRFVSRAETVVLRRTRGSSPSAQPSSAAQSCRPPQGIAPGVAATTGPFVTIFGPTCKASGDQSEGTGRDEHNRRRGHNERKGRTERRLPVRQRPETSTAAGPRWWARDRPP